MKLTKKKAISKYINLLSKNYPSLKEQYKINYLGIFGSFVRNEQKENSDLDLLISFEKTPTLFQFIRLEQYLSNLLSPWGIFEITMPRVKTINNNILFSRFLDNYPNAFIILRYLLKL